MCDFDRFRVLTEERWRQQEGLTSPPSADETSPAHVHSTSNVSHSQTSRKGGTADRLKGSSKDDLLPNPKLEAGNKLPHRLGDYFSVKKYAGRPLEDIDEYYHNKQTFVVIARDKTIFRFSTSKAFYLLSPFNPIRRTAMYILTHPLFSFIILLAIVVNCIFMAMPNSGINEKVIECTFTAIYSSEAVIKVMARGFILNDYAYLRDAWNWLDFIVISLAYFMFISPNLGKVSALRTLRVLRALKTVTTVPGLKTIVGALIEATKRLRDVMVLTIFVLSIFALVGLQLYRGTLLQKCVRIFNDSAEAKEVEGQPNDVFEAARDAFHNDPSNWFEPVTVCALSGSGQTCPENHECVRTKTGNPNHNFTSYDNFGFAFLCAFRLMTQDYWENLYQITIKANGMFHIIYFVLVILLGSFYLMNVILAIVAMSYDEVRLSNLANEEEEEAEKKEEEELREQMIENIIQRSPSELSNMSYMEIYCLEEAARREHDDRVEKVSVCSERLDERRPRPRYYSIKKRKTCSIPGTPADSRHRFATPKTQRRRLMDEDEDEQDLKEQEEQSEADPEQPALRAPLRRRRIRHASLVAANTRGPRRERQLSEGNDSSAAEVGLPFGSVPFVDDSSAETPLCDLGRDDLLGAFAPSRRLFRPLGSPRGHGSPTLPTKTAVLDRIASSSSPFEVRLCRSILNRSPSLPPRQQLETEPDGEGGTGAKFSPHFGSRLLPDANAGSITIRTRSRGPSVQNSVIDLKDVVVLKTLVDDTAGDHQCSLPTVLDEPKQPLKDVLLRWFQEKFCSWTCCPLWFKIEYYTKLFILDAFVELYITLCIVANTLFMAIDTPTKSESLGAFLATSNYFFTATFALEALLKLIAMQPKVYFKENWNLFDFFIVVLSFVELPLANVKGLSIFRAFRLLRVFKLAKSWKTMNLLFAIIGRTIGALGNLIVVLGIIVFIFAVVGMQLFGENYDEFKNITRYPQYRGLGVRWHFQDFGHSFMIVFRVLCGEWIESMWNCMLVNGWKCVPFFLLTMCIANLVVFNLFLALLLSSFGSETFQRSEGEEEPNKLQEAIDRITRFVTWTKIHVSKRVTRVSNYVRSLKSSNNKALTINAAPVKPKALDLDYTLSESVVIQMENGKATKDGEEERFEDGKMFEEDGKSTIINHVNRPVIPACDSLKDRSPIFDEDPEVNEVEIIYFDTPDDCLPHFCMARCTGLFERWNATRVGQFCWTVRCRCFRVIEHTYFEGFIIFMIIISSLTLTLEDSNLDQKIWLKTILNVLDKTFTVIFTAEMLLKWVALGWKKYFKDAWCWLDFTIVMIALLSLLMNNLGTGAGDLQSFKAMRTLRALRPLRAVSRWEGMKVVVNALIQAIPSIFNVLLVCVVLWLIFSIMGVQMFGGMFYKCVDLNGTRLMSSFYNKTNCQNYETWYQNVTWKNSAINFDNFLMGYLALFQVATNKGWIEIMADAVDITDIDLQPQYENKAHLYIFFVLFLVVGSFFTLNLFIGVIIENFNVQKKKAGGSIQIFMTDEQKKYYKAMKKMDSGTLQKPLPRPKDKVGLFFYMLVTHQTYDILIMVFIMLNTFVMCIEYHGQSEQFQKVLKVINQVFVIIFTGESVMKLLGQRLYYFKLPWNIFDFSIVIFSLVCLFIEDLMKTINFSPTIIRIVRVFRIGRVLRLVKSARGIRTLLFSLFVSLPALFNIAILLIMVMFIYSIIGMSFFADVPKFSGIDDVFNFKTFPQAMMTLFQITTTAGWNGVLDGLANNPNCPGPDEHKEDERGRKVSCPGPTLAIAYLCSFLMISSMVIVNMYIAVILENFSQATEDVQQGLTQDDFDIFYEKWENYDTKARGFIQLDQVCDFLHDVDKPLGVKKPNSIKVATLQVPIREGDVVYCVDLLDKVTRDFLGTLENEEMGNISGPKEKAKEQREIISDTLRRQREHVAARSIARFLRLSREGKPFLKPSPKVPTPAESEDEPKEASRAPSAASTTESGVKRRKDENVVEVTSDSQAVV